MSDDIVSTFVGNNINGSFMLKMWWEVFKYFGMTQAGPLDLLLKWITSLCTEAISVDHGAYYFGKILKKIGYNKCQSKGDMLPVYILELHRYHFKKIMNFLFSGDSTYLIYLERDIDPTIIFQISEFSN